MTQSYPFFFQTKTFLRAMGKGQELGELYVDHSRGKPYFLGIALSNVSGYYLRQAIIVSALNNISIEVKHRRA
jgi:hypothetical protein